MRACVCACSVRSTDERADARARARCRLAQGQWVPGASAVAEAWQNGQRRVAQETSPKHDKSGMTMMKPRLLSSADSPPYRLQVMAWHAHAAPSIPFPLSSPPSRSKQTDTVDRYRSQRSAMH